MGAANNPAAGLTVHLLGRPRVEIDGADGYRFRSRKSWALLAFLLLSERPPTRSRLASLLFSEADDPLGALRWCLAEVRRGLGPGAVLDGDPVQLVMPKGASLDVDVLVHGHWHEAVQLPGLGLDLLDGVSIAGADAYEAWLLSQRRRLAAAAESIVHEAALGLLARGDLDRARALAVQATAMSPLDENHQALLIRIYRLAGDDEAAARQFQAWCTTAERELGMSPGAVVLMAAREQRAVQRPATRESIRAVTEGGAAAVSAGAITAGITSFEQGVRMADESGVDSTRVQTRLVLAEALIHTLGGLDEAGVAALTEAERIATAQGDAESIAAARAELGYVDFLRARYDRAERLLEQVLAADDATPSARAKALTYLGSVASDQGDYPRAITLLEEAIRASHAVREPRREAFALSMLGRVGLLRGDIGSADVHLRSAIELGEAQHWLSFLPWPQALLGHVLLARGDVDGAGRCLEQSFARACQIGDPCWEGISARGLALHVEATGRPDQAFADLLDARSRANRLADPYVWLDVHILDALCEMGCRHGHPMTASWAEQMHDRASRAGMQELTVRAMLHGARLGIPGDAEAAVILGSTIDNPLLAARLLDGTPRPVSPPGSGSLR